MLTQIQTFENSNIINGLFLAFALTLVFIYALWSNNLAVGRYQIKDMEDKLAQLQEKNTLLISKKLANEDLYSLREFAQKNNMIIAEHVSYIFENGNIALQR